MKACASRISNALALVRISSPQSLTQMNFCTKASHLEALSTVHYEVLRSNHPTRKNDMQARSFNKQNHKLDFQQMIRMFQLQMGREGGKNAGGSL